MKKVLIISWQQFGYHTDTYNYCLYLNNKFNIKFICFDENLKKVNVDGIEVRYLKFSANKILNKIKFLNEIISLRFKFKPDLIFVRYFKGCSILKKCLFNKNTILDIRTASVFEDEELRNKNNELITREAKCFNNITVITEGVANVLKLNLNKVKILPLGGKKIKGVNIDKRLNYNELNLLYVGTFDGRNIEKTIQAFNKVSEKYNGKDLSYTIIGFACDDKYFNKINKLIKENKFNNINFLGRINNENLGVYLNKSNLGVAYVPTTDYYDHQPPTKTYEYIFNGLFTIATNTTENRKVINDINGILIGDTVEEFEKCLEKIYKERRLLNKMRFEIAKTVESYSWENICKELEEYFYKVMNH